ncbi:MAG TPA: DNA recombination protein RmuC [Acidobacteriaceae bacterium]|nr:DNA recombination protein RmuC [Acidobacteriaceae bacterium]
MTLALLAVELLLLIAILFVVLRRRQAGSEPAIEDPRLAALASELPTHFARLETRLATLDEHLRSSLAQVRTDTSSEAQAGREAAERSAAALRTEVLGNVNALGEALRSGLDSFRQDNTRASETLRQSVEAQLGGLTQRFMGFATDMAQQHGDNRDALDRSLADLRATQASEQEKLRESVQQRLELLRDSNEKKLEEMRNVVDEKLQKTLHSRLTESFGQVTDQLAKVHTGLGEMNTLSAGVSDLNRMFSNVKSRGGFAEVQLGNLLEQVLASGQYVKNARVKENTQEVVEYAVKFPGPAGDDVLLPIDAKFPREDWERLESAYELGDQAAIEQARRAFDSAIRTEGKRICSKYINEPVTTPYAIMFLPTEGLYAEVLRRDGLQAELHQQCRVMVAGPSNLYALLTSFKLGFSMLNLQKKGNEVWNVLSRAQKEFKTFEGLMDSMEKQVGTVQNTIQKLGVRTRAINRTLRDVGTEADGSLPGHAAALHGVLPLLAAEDDE